jgi:rhodanese-related sulfurtransferase
MDAREAFARSFLETLRARGETRTLDYDRERFAIELREGESIDLFYLANSFAEHEAAAPEARAAVLERWAAFAGTKRVPPAATLNEALVNLMPRVRERASFGLAALEIELELFGRPELTDAQKKHGFGTPCRPVADVYAVSICIDMPTMVMDVEGTQLDGWDIDFARAMELALTNLKRRTEGPSFDQVALGVYESTWRDSFDATRILLPDVIRSLKVNGDPVAFLLQPHRLLVTGSEDVLGLETAIAIATEAMSEPRFMGSVPLRLTGEGWVAFTPPHDRELGLALWKIRAQTAIGNYDAQKRLLDALFEKQGRRIFVPRFTAMVSEGGGLAFTYAAWAEAPEPIALPEVETVLMGRPEQVYRARFDRVRAALGARMVDLGLYPRRWLVESFPTAAELAAMEAEAMPMKAPNAAPSRGGPTKMAGAAGPAVVVGGSVTAKDLAKLLADGRAVAIDVRDTHSFGRSRLPAARSIPAEEIEQHREALNALGARPVLYDRSGDKAKELGTKLGLTYLEGGVLAWESEGLPIERP